MGKESKQVLKLALYGAIAAVIIDHFVQPSIKSAVGVK